MNPSQKQTSTPQRRQWERPEVKSVGTVGNIIEGGGGKASVAAADSGDSRKPNGQG